MPKKGPTIKTGSKSDDRLIEEERALNRRLAVRYARYQDDELMQWLKSFSRRHLLARFHKKS